MKRVTRLVTLGLNTEYYLSLFQLPLRVLLHHLDLDGLGPSPGGGHDASPAVGGGGLCLLLLLLLLLLVVVKGAARK